MSLGSLGYQPTETTSVDSDRLTENTDFHKIRHAARRISGEHRTERFITDFYAVVLESPRDYSTLLENLRSAAADNYIIVDSEELPEAVCQKIWNEIGRSVEVSGRWYVDFMAIICEALRACPYSSHIRY